MSMHFNAVETHQTKRAALHGTNGEREKGPIEQDSYDMILNPSHNVPHFDNFAPLLNQS